jgi:hypothetical protein
MASTPMKMVERIASPHYMAKLLGLLVIASPKVKQSIALILNNLMKLKLPYEIFEEAIEMLIEQIPDVHQLIDHERFFKNSKFLRLIFSLIQGANDYAYSEQQGDQTTFAVTVLLSNLLKDMSLSQDSSSWQKQIKEELEDLLIKKIKTSQLKDFSSMLSLIPGGDYAWLGRGVNAMVKSTGDRVKVLGYTSNWMNTKDVDMDKNPQELHQDTTTYLRKMINEFSNCIEKVDQKALVYYYNPNAKHRMELMLIDAHDMNIINGLENKQMSEMSVLSVLMNQQCLEAVVQGVLDNDISLIKRTLLFKMLMT